MPERLTPERLAEIREAGVYSGAFRELCDHIDASEVLLDEYRKQFAEDAASKNRLEGMVAALREALGAGIAVWDGSHLLDCPFADMHIKAESVLADTEAAAKAHDQRERSEGAREFVRRYEVALALRIRPDSVFKQTLADIETEAGL